MKKPGPMMNAELSRRSLLQSTAAGFGYLALAGLMADSMPRALGAADEALPLAPRMPHFPARAKRVIFLFMHGGPSQVDTFDYKPLLERDNGKPLPFAKPRIVSSQTGALLRSPWKFKQAGQAGHWISELFPNIATVADQLCVINSMCGSNSRHGAALLELHTGSDTFVRPSMGSWITYGLGSENRDLPGFITLCPTLGHGGNNAWNSAFLPADYQGTAIGFNYGPADKAKIPFIKNADTSASLQKMELAALEEANREHLSRTGPDGAMEARIKSFELAFGMQMAVPELQDLSNESKATLDLYGIRKDPTNNFGTQCLLARRFSERGVRFVQATHGYWDQHGDLKRDHAKNASQIDKPIAGLLKDLKSRGLLDETLVIWGGEFGRTPTGQGGDGRDHNEAGFTYWMAGAGVKAGLRYGATDDYGYFAAENKVHFHDLHATLLHILGIDHLKLTYKYAGRDFRLTDVHGNIVTDILG